MRLMVYGRMPVLEALADHDLAVERLLVARNAKGDTIDAILAVAATRGVTVTRVTPEKVSRVSGNGRHDQGVVADVEAPAVQELDDWLGTGGSSTDVLVLDGITNPANVGMIVRTVVAAGLDGVVLPRTNAPDVGPLVVKASAGIAFRATILRAPTSADAVASLRAAGSVIVGMRAGAPSIFAGSLPSPAAWVLGAEHDGVSPAVSRAVDAWRAIPLAGGVDSLNVAVAAGVLAYELARRRP